ncbi:uncharacterized protein LOC116300953 [Actinia tenebrosa]|uniref:Uncharacterized protein LOC116300953 n=1 Tax=Actinia tenebrosa TaxID=6105 RepID=A0A6P8IGD2_ACTTE|nr:uncharacterized protein LOC116300953 [Actinia tenebrosa]
MGDFLKAKFFGCGPRSRNNETRGTETGRADSIAGGVQGSTVGSASENQVDATERPNNVSSSRGPTQNIPTSSEHDERQNQTRGSSGNNDQLQLPQGYRLDDIIDKDSKLYKRYLLHIAKNLTTGDDWKNLGGYLRISNNALDSISVDYGGQVKERAYQMLIKWTESSHEPTLKSLLDGLEMAGQRQLVHEISEVLRENSNQPQGGQQVTESHFLGIASDILDDWRFIGRYLGLKESVIREIEEKNIAHMKAYEMLIVWKKRNGREATLEVLQAALHDVGKEDLVKKLRQELLNE